MADTSVANGAANLTEEEYKKLCKQVRQYQLKKGATKSKKLKPVLNYIGKTISVKKEFLVQEASVDWDLVPVGAPFSLDTSGAILYTKSGKSKALCVNTMSVVQVGGATVHRVFF
jgi:hypothetical protein